MGRGPRKRKAAEGAAGPDGNDEEPPVANEGRKKKSLDGAESTAPENKDGAESAAPENKTHFTVPVLESAAAPVSGLAEGARCLAAWADNPAKIERWLTSRGGGLEGPLLEAPGGMLRLRDYIPLQVADAVLAMLEGLPEEVWELSEHGDDDGAAKHAFWSADVCDVEELSSLRSVLWKLLPSFRGEPTLPIFSIGRYGSTNFIGRHDDRAHVPFFGGGKIYSRTVAAIWYLTRDWSEQDGGSLQDLEASAGAEKSLVPVYNSFVAFEVPHMHAVTPVTSNRYRYSIFGWWHQQGKRYELPGVPSDGAQVLRKKKKHKAKSSATAASSTDPAVESE